jgi:uncharacterized cysteine cluster protein YcgN (CxxCxxCC family)
VGSGSGFWEDKPLNALDPQEWESLCDGCGRCCLHKLEDEDDGTLHYTAVACRQLDLDSCRCRDYSRRRELEPDCLVVAPENLHWLPPTCAYRLAAAGRPLPPWHPLLTGNPETVHAAGISVRSFGVGAEVVDGDWELEDFILPPFGQPEA